MQKEENRKEAPCCSSDTDYVAPKFTDISKNQKEHNPQEGKLSVDIFVPLDACACEWDKFMNRAFEAITPYIKHIKYETKNLNSDEARNLNLHGNSIVIDGNKKFTATYLLKKELPNILREKGLI